jgi:hypothetical protein
VPLRRPFIKTEAAEQQDPLNFKAFQGGSPPDRTLWLLAARLGWADSAEMRRLCTFGYDLRPVLRLLAALPLRLRAVLASFSDVNCGGRAASTDGDIWYTGNKERDEGSESQWDEAREVFSFAEERARWAMEEEDAGTGFLEVDFDPATQRRVNVFLTTRYAAQRGAARPALLGAFAAHAVPLPAAAADFLAAALHAAALRRLGSSDCTQYLRVSGAGGRAALVREDTRTRFDSAGRVVRVRGCLPV